MKTILAFTAVLTALIVNLAPQTAHASEWEFFGKKVEVGHEIVATVPVGEKIASSTVGALSVESIGSSGVTLRSEGSSSYAGISIFAPSGDTATVRSLFWKSLYPAIRIKVLSVDTENGTARIEVSQFWPYPDQVQVDGAK